ncbi:MAG: CPBP family intramembrane metalloprotease [Methanomicrobiaceae archaeon]|nr:CPBP family intramembrane metalloprotease [Methanomicrobiaceae archaeon]
MSSVCQLIKKYQLISYFVLAFAITWAVFCIPFFYTINDPATFILAMGIGGTGPAFAAIILSRIIKPEKVETDSQMRWTVFSIAFVVTATSIILYLGISPDAASFPLLLLVIVNSAIAAYIISGGLANREGIRNLLKRLYIWKTGWKWYVAALALIPVIMYVTMIICSVITGNPLTGIIPEISLGVASSVIIALGYVTLVRGPLREEIGWRGFALPRLQYLYSPLVGTLLLGIIWTIWHLPLHLNGVYGNGMGGFIERFYFNIGVTFLFTWIYNHTKGSLLMTTFFHTSVNTTATVLLIPAAITGPYYLVFCALVNIGAVIVILADRMWKKLPGDHEAVYKY